MAETFGGEFDKTMAESYLGFLKEALMNMGMTPPEGVLEEMFKEMDLATVENFDTLFERFGQAYDTISERYTAVENGGRGGMPLPDIEGMLEAVNFEDETVAEGMLDAWNTRVNEIIAEPEVAEKWAQMPEYLISENGSYQNIGRQLIFG
jgi:hypothetical protein